MTEEEINRCLFWINANKEVRSSGSPNYAGKRIQVNNNWNLDVMEKWLENYKDKQLLEYLRYGWPLNAINTEINNTVPNNQQGVQDFPKVRKYLKQELEAGTIFGPFLKNPFGKHARFSPLDTREKKDSQERRVILN